MAKVFVILFVLIYYGKAQNLTITTTQFPTLSQNFTPTTKNIVTSTILTTLMTQSFSTNIPTLGTFPTFAPLYGQSTLEPGVYPSIGTVPPMQALGNPVNLKFRFKLLICWK